MAVDEDPTRVRHNVRTNSPPVGPDSSPSWLPTSAATFRRRRVWLLVGLVVLSLAAGVALWPRPPAPGTVEVVGRATEIVVAAEAVAASASTEESPEELALASGSVPGSSLAVDELGRFDVLLLAPAPACDSAPGWRLSSDDEGVLQAVVSTTGRGCEGTATVALGLDLVDLDADTGTAAVTEIAVELADD